MDVENKFDYFYDLLKNLKSLNGKTNKVSLNLMRAILETVCLSVIREMKQLRVAPQKSVTSEIISYINNNYRKRLTVQSLASRFELSPNYLGQLFLKEMGMPVSQYIKRCRLSMAANLINNSNLNFNSIAYEVGFLSPYVFSREFKKFFHVSPKEYRTRNKNE